MSKTRVFIYGSCVSRDTFEHLDPDLFQLVEYVARQSILSATTHPVEAMAPPTLESAFQQRMITGDFRSSLRPSFVQRAGEIDVLLIDLTDERLGAYLLPDGTVVTRSVELIESGAERLLPQGSHHLAFGTQQHYEYWSGAVRALGDAIRKTLPQVTVALLDIPWAERSENGGPTPDSFGVSAADANPVLRSYVEVAAQALGAHVISLDPAEVLSGPHHPWGEAPFHYAEKVYLDVVRRLTGIEGREVWGPGAQAPSGAQASVPSAPTRATRVSVHERRAPGGTGQQAQAPSQQAPGQPLRRLEGGPNFLIAGTQRGGTQWLQHQLNRHPQLHVAKDSTPFFSQPGRLTKEDEILKFLKPFANGKKPLLGHRSPGYFWVADPKSKFSTPRKQGTAAAIRDMLDPSAPVLLSLRNPVERAISAYWRHFSNADIELGAGIFQTPARLGIVDRGFYRRHYEDWARTLGPERLHLLVFDDLVERPRKYLQEALGALRVADAPEFWGSLKPKVKIGNVGWLPQFKKQSPITAQEIAALHALYADDIRFMEEILGRKLPKWHNVGHLVKQYTAEGK
ncbi:sulfotransferase family protein [Promicromonospora sp. AC04]|uniref:DUF6270 domain-containing protein n=1 Tax=Promicromonospora sp. AC04 TaxID=2135723 RepID=UPI000D36C788|nr:DUF6270 domain-containing protein [Promicromonospora sp. AC04]PUB32362.1 sulfotransferase family protein [Promicromonospora sp. AC04]